MLADTIKNQILPQVQKPGQYIGNEWGVADKDWDSAKSRMALIYPDLYELGMSNFGIKILYNIVNSHPDYLCDRAFAPMPDMEELMRQHNLPLWAWESYKPLSEFDFLGFSLGYELCYTNILTILDLAKIPFYSKDRTNEPLIFAGGPAVFNPEPMAEFFDFYIIGDGEELIVEVQDVVQAARGLGLVDRDSILHQLAQLQGVYVPRFYEPNPETFIPEAGSFPYPVKKRITKELTDLNQPISGPVPHIQTVQDKQVLEIRRGCDRGCRFCQVGYTYLPVRERSPEDLLRLSQESARQSGYDDFTLLSLSASDYTCLTEAARAINNEHAADGLALSMPSQRADRFNVDLAVEVSGARKSGMTFAPEAGSERMRRIINKGLSQEDIYRAIKGTHEQGWSKIKLYFMIGLPFEEDEDLDAILDIFTWSINMSKQLRKEDPKKYKRPLQINCTISTFVPKTFTAFQWFPQCTIEEFHRKQEYLRQGLRERKLHKTVKLNCTEPELAQIEAVLSRGDRRWGEVIKTIWESGSRFDSWSENFNIERWKEAAQKHGLSLEEEASRYREPGSKQCWDVVSCGFTDEFLVGEWREAEQEVETAPCTENKCHACGVCFNLDVKNLVTKDVSDKNPFVTEIDVEKRKKSCSNFSELSHLGPVPKRDINPANPKVVVRNTESRQKLRLKISKLDDLRFISHLDFQRLLERALRRSGLPVIHTVGFNQRMKITWLSALPLFVESNGEYLEIDLAEQFADLENFKEILQQELPKQARIIEVIDVSLGGNLSINNVLETVYLAKLIDYNQQANASSINLDKSVIDSFLEQEQILYKKLSKGKEKIIDLKERILKMKIIDDSTIELSLEKTQRPDEVLSVFIPGATWRIRKVDTKFASADLVAA